MSGYKKDSNGQMGRGYFKRPLLGRSKKHTKNC